MGKVGALFAYKLFIVFFFSVTCPYMSLGYSFVNTLYILIKPAPHLLYFSCVSQLCV